MISICKSQSYFYIKFLKQLCWNWIALLGSNLKLGKIKSAAASSLELSGSSIWALSTFGEGIVWNYLLVDCGRSPTFVYIIFYRCQLADIWLWTPSGVITHLNEPSKLGNLDDWYTQDPELPSSVLPTSGQFWGRQYTTFQVKTISRPPLEQKCFVGNVELDCTVLVF